MIEVKCESCGEVRHVGIKYAKNQFKKNGNNFCRSCSSIKKIKESINGTKILKDLGLKNFGNYKKRIALFECKYCKSEFEARIGDISSGKQDGCMCRTGIKSNGKKETPKLYMIWQEMHARCRRSTHKSYENYGGRGIFVDSKWNDFNNFRFWSITNGYIEGVGLSIDRIDNNLEYSENNCRWTNAFIQASNKRYGLKETKTNQIGVFNNGKKFYYSITHKGKKFYEGNFNTIEEAVNARRDLIIKMALPHTKIRKDSIFNK